MSNSTGVNAFTVKYSGISNRLLTTIDIVAKDLKYTTTALWDTGATNSCISDEVAKKLSLIPTKKKNIVTPSGMKEVSTYFVDLILPNRVCINNVEVNGSEIGKQDLGVLIGMDIITLGDFSLSNKGETIFSFQIPSTRCTDFVMQAEIANKTGRHGKGSKRKRK